MNQSIEDASLEFDNWFHQSQHKFNLKDRYEALVVWRAAWQAARQSSQSEPVGYVSNNFKENLKLGIKIDVSRTPYKHLTMPIYLAAPQQAIPADWRKVIKGIRDADYTFGKDSVNVVNVVLDCVIDGIDDLVSASPTAPIESDK
jgi:hypothetical protein